MRHIEAVNKVAAGVRDLWRKYGARQDYKGLAFALSLVPIPVSQQFFQHVDRHLSDKDLDRKIKEIWAAIIALRPSVDACNSVEDSIFEIAKVVESSSDLQRDMKALLGNIGSRQREFAVFSEDRSFQHILNTLINAERVLFQARSGSENLIERSHITADRTVLRASGGSRNVVKDSTFNGPGGGASFGGAIAVKGDVQLVGPSIEFRGHSTLDFGGAMITCTSPSLPPKPTARLTCGVCKHEIDRTLTSLKSVHQLSCKKCGNLLSVPPQLYK